MNKRLDKIEPCESKIVSRKWIECVAFKWIFHGLMFFLFFFFFFRRMCRFVEIALQWHTPRYLWIFSRCFEHIIFIYNLAIHRWRARQSRGVKLLSKAFPPLVGKTLRLWIRGSILKRKKEGEGGKKRKIPDAISRDNEKRFLTRKIMR